MGSGVENHAACETRDRHVVLRVAVTAVAVVVIVFTLLRGSSHPVTPTPTRVAQPSVLLPRTLVSYLCARV